VRNVVLLASLSGLAAAQIRFGWVEVSVHDSSTSSPIENAEVRLEDGDGRNLLIHKTTATGELTLLGILPGSYTLVIEKENYPSYQVRALEVASGSVSVVNIELVKGKPGDHASVPSDWKGGSSDPWASDAGSYFEPKRLDSLPSARNIWALLQNQDVSSVTDHLDAGGLQSGVPALVGAHGGTWTQNGYRWDGLNITNPFVPGKPLSYPDYDSLEDFRISGSQHAAGIPASGAEFQINSRRGGSRLHGQAQAYYTGDPLQGDNLDSRLREFGYQTTPHFEHFPEGEFSLGGPVPHFRAWSFFTSLGFQHLSRVMPDFNGMPVTGIYSGILRLDRPLGERNDVSLLVSGQIARNSNLGAGPGIEPSSTLQGNDRYELIQGHWTRRQSERSMLDVAFGFSHSSPTDTLQAGITGPNYTRLFTGEMTGAAPVESDSALSRFSLRGQMQTLRGSTTGMRHLLVFGMDLEESLATEEQRVFQGLNLLLFPDREPSEVEEFNSPSHAMQRLRELSVFAEDRLQISRRVFIRLGATLDSSNASLPEQNSGAGVFVPERQFAGAGSVVSWTTLSPSLGVTVPLSTRLGETRLVAAYSRYYHILPAAYADYANPTALGSRLYRWNDPNGDGLFQPGEEGALLRVFGGPYSSVDPNLRRPFTDEYGISLEHDLNRVLQASVRLLERNSKHLVHTVNVGVPALAYAPVTVLDPGEDGIPGTADDRALTVFDQDPRTLGQDRYVLTNPSGFNARSRGLEATLTSRLAGRGFFSISFSAYNSVGDGNPGNSVLENDPGVPGTLFDNPNASTNSRGRLYFDRAYVGKIAGYYPVPFGFRLGSVITYFDGLPFGRELIIPNLNQGPCFVMATPRGEPGGFRTQYYLNFDLRIAREFELGKVRMTVLADIFNLLNSNKNLRESDITGPLFALRVPLDIQNPRALRLGIRLGF
jgi:hypothetical protein